MSKEKATYNEGKTTIDTSSTDESKKTTKSKGKVIIEDVTAEAEKANAEKEPIVNKANDYKEFWKDIKSDEHRINDDTPEFHIYISFEKVGGDGVQKDLSTTKAEEDLGGT